MWLNCIENGFKMRKESISYTKSQWMNYIEKVTRLYRNGETVEGIAKELNVSEELIKLTIKTQINRQHCPKLI